MTRKSLFREIKIIIVVCLIEMNFEIISENTEIK
jgi:hypothetical protein